MQPFNLKLSPLLLAPLLALPLPALAQSGAAGDVPVAQILDTQTYQRVGDRLDATAAIHDSRAIYRVRTPNGTEQVTGTVSMLERITELDAVTTLESMKKSDVYTDALKSSAKAPVNYGKALIDDPGGTLKDSARGLGGFLADVGYSIVSDDPSQENVAKTGLGHAAAMRSFAFELGVNPYTRYEPLRELMGEVSWAAVGGGLTVGAAFRAVRNTPGSVLTITKTANTGRVLVRDKSPRELHNRNEESLRGMGMSDSLIETLLDNYSFDPEAETRLVVALESMKGVEGREGALSRAALADSHNTADLMRDWMELIAAYHTDVQPIAGLAIVSTGIFPIDKDGRAHAVFPTDYVSAAPNVQSHLEDVTGKVKAAGYTPGPMFVTGVVEPTMVSALEKMGWGPIRDRAGKTLRESAGSGG